MAEKNLGALVVVEDEKGVGMVSKRVYTRNVILKGKLSKNTLVKDIINSKVCYVRPEQTLDDSSKTTFRVACKFCGPQEPTITHNPCKALRRILPSPHNIRLKTTEREYRKREAVSSLF